MRMVRHLSSCEACYEVVTETVRFQEEEEEAETGTVVPFPVVTRAMPRWRIAASLAAGLAVVVLGGLLWRSAGAPADLSVERLAAGFASGEALRTRLGDGWTQTGWIDVRRGAGDLPREVTELRLGVRVVDLQLALRAGNVETAGDLAEKLVGLLRGLEGTEDLSAAYQGLKDGLDRGEPPASVAGLAAAREGSLAERLEGRLPYRLGKWAEAGRLAARTGDRGFFEARDTRAFLRDLEGEQPSGPLAAPLAQIEEIKKRPARDLTEEDLERLEEAFTQIVTQRGG